MLMNGRMWHVLNITEQDTGRHRDRKMLVGMSEVADKGILVAWNILHMM